MNIPDCRTIAFEQGILAEPSSDPNRIVLWVPGNRDATFQYWERVGNVARAEISSEHGLCATPATLVPTRQRLRGGLSQLFKGLRRSTNNRDFLLPDGSSSEQCGERRTDLLLVWSLDPESPLDETRIQSAWPTSNRSRKLGQNFFMVCGVQTRAETSAEPADPQPAPLAGSPKEQAEALVAAARRAGDRAAEATALTDLGVTLISESNSAAAVASFQAALAIVRELRDAERENDVIGNLGLALLGVGQAPQARQAFEQCLGYVRSKRDHLGEKTTMERLGLAHWHLREFSVASELLRASFEHGPARRRPRRQLTCSGIRAFSMPSSGSARWRSPKRRNRSSSSRRWAGLKQPGTARICKSIEWVFTKRPQPQPGQA